MSMLSPGLLNLFLQAFLVLSQREVGKEHVVAYCIQQMLHVPLQVCVRHDVNISEGISSMLL